MEFAILHGVEKNKTNDNTEEVYKPIEFLQIVIFPVVGSSPPLDPRDNLLVFCLL